MLAEQRGCLAVFAVNPSQILGALAVSVPLGSGTSVPTGISSIAGAKNAGAGNGANGSASLVWNSCVYDLAVTKSVLPVNTPINAM